eukprot:2337713-Prymnesium_polylepis.2
MAAPRPLRRRADARGAAGGRHGAAPLRLEPRAGDAVHGGAHDPRALGRGDRGRALLRAAGAGVLVQGGAARHTAAARRAAGEPRRQV